MELYRNIRNDRRTNARCSMGHLKEVKRGYFSHAGHALALSSTMIMLGLAGVVHSVVPVVFKKTVSNGVGRLKNKIAADNRRIRKRNG